MAKSKMTNEEIFSHLQATRKAAITRTPRGYTMYRGKFRAQIGIGRGKLFLGDFDTAEAAAAAYIQAKEQRDILRKGGVQWWPHDSM